MLIDSAVPKPRIANRASQDGYHGFTVGSLVVAVQQTPFRVSVARVDSPSAPFVQINREGLLNFEYLRSKADDDVPAEVPRADATKVCDAKERAFFLWRSIDDRESIKAGRMGRRDGRRLGAAAGPQS